jgi:hypothetical protein
MEQVFPKMGIKGEGDLALTIRALFGNKNRLTEGQYEK